MEEPGYTGKKRFLSAPERPDAGRGGDGLRADPPPTLV